ncbi:unnamed protein product [Soboliphyme baturini]|uniref:RSN1_TM domain-containing protein n=1 Tax=Soboliphyme baturini TaxID=241478 RepID=A0A183J238_9BILA|nr:unnamed protein product [Soboliphyme baturini]
MTKLALRTLHSTYLRKKVFLQEDRGAAGSEVVVQSGFEGDVEAIYSTQRFGFWTFIFAVCMLLFSCICFPLVRYIPLLKLFIQSRSKKGRDKGYQLVSKVFREHGRVPPTFKKYKKIHRKLGPEGDPLLMLKH